MLMYDDGRMDTPHSRSTHLFALLRYDEPVDRENRQSAVSVVKVVTRRGAAEAELRRQLPLMHHRNASMLLKRPGSCLNKTCAVGG
jgi:hypothetical protein